MTRGELLQKIVEAANEALTNSDAFNEACEHLDKLGYQRRIAVNINIFPEAMTAEPAAVAAEADADFLRSLRIAPDLEAR
jgi:hypothetical protein